MLRAGTGNNLLQLSDISISKDMHERPGNFIINFLRHFSHKFFVPQNPGCESSSYRWTCCAVSTFAVQELRATFNDLMICSPGDQHVWELEEVISRTYPTMWPHTHTHTGCPRRNGQNFGRVLLMLKYTDITQNTYIQSWTVTEIMAREVWKYDSFYTLTDYQIHIETGRNMWFLQC